MAGNKQSGKTLVETMIKKYGSYEAFRQSMRERAYKGGKNGNKEANPNYGGGFASKSVGDDGLTGYERARVAGAIGGRKSRRRKKVNNG